MKISKYPKIEQFRNVVQSINLHASYVGKDESGDPIYDGTIPKPILTFKGTVKLHGTNAGVSYTKRLGLRTQSRNRGYALDNLDLHSGFTQWVEAYKKWFKNTLAEIHSNLKLNDDDKVTMYGEWAGKGIQKGVAISELSKAFYVFGLKVHPSNEEIDSYWVSIDDIGMSGVYGIYSINEFRTFQLKIDFNNPKLSQNELIEITKAVEVECPVAKKLGISGIGEGVVWSCEWEGNMYRFKVKGEKHSVSKVKKLAEVDVEKINSVNDFTQYAVTENRVNQGITEVFGADEKTKARTGDFLRWIANDIMKEESDTLAKNELEWKDVARDVSTKARTMFFKIIDNELQN